MSAQRQITGGKQDVQKTERQKGLHPRRADRRSGHPGHPGRPAGSGSDWLH